MPATELPLATAHTRAEAKRLEGLTLQDFATHGGLTATEVMGEIGHGRLKVFFVKPEGREYYSLFESDGRWQPHVDAQTGASAMSKYGIILADAVETWLDSGSPLVDRFIENMSDENRARTQARGWFAAINFRPTP